jgi:hypothetical protein
MSFISVGSEQPVVAISCPRTDTTCLGTTAGESPCAEVNVGMTAFFGLLSFVITELI